MDEPLIRTEGLTRRFGGLTAVEGVDFAIRAGEIRGLIGPNGAGKTTLVSLLGGRMRPSAGRILWQGRDVTRLPAFERVRLGLGYTFQVTSIFPRLSVAENVALAVRGEGSRTALAARVGAVLDAVGLAGEAGVAAAELPYGRQRLVELAMGLALSPKLLMLDEPTQGLSDGEIGRFVDLVRAAARTATVLLIDHNMDVVMALATRITVMAEGRILAEGAPVEIRANAAVRRAYLGRTVEGEAGG